MEASAERPHRLPGFITTGARLTAVAALSTALYSGDKPEFQGDIWVVPNADEAVVFAASVDATENDDFQIGVATYNMKYGREDRAEAVETARSLGAYVLGLTEAGPSIGGEVAQDDYIVTTGEAGNMLLSLPELPVLQSFSLQLPREAGTSYRSAMFAELDIHGESVWFVLTHLTHDQWPTSESNRRQEQLDVIQQQVDELGIDPIMLGDLNFEPGSDNHDQITEDYDDCLEELGIGHAGTFQGFTGLRRLDYILVDEDLDLSAFAGGRSSGEGSDHFPIMVVLETTNPPSSVSANIAG